jgi:structural maintenance of chromosome 4
VVSNKTIFDKSKKAADKIQKQVDGFTTQITEITNTKVKSVQTKISGLTKQIDKLASNISKLTVDITQSERNLNKTIEKINNLEAEITAAQDSLRKSDEERTVEDQKILQFTEEAKKLKEDLEEIRGGSSGVKKEIDAILKRENDGKMKRLELEQILQTIEKKLGEVKNLIPHWKRKLQPLKLEPIPGQTDPEEPLKTFTNEELEAQNLEQIQYQLAVQEEELNSCKPNLSVIEEFVKKREAYLQSFQILEDITQKRNEMRQLYDEVKKKRFTEFMMGFNIITKKLKEMYQMITLGGDAELELVDSMDPFNEGIVFSVRPPKKSWKMISNLSGGEKTLSSLALVFALHYYKPSPLYVK